MGSVGGLCVRGRGSKSVLKCKEMFVRSAAAAQLLGNGMKQHKETKGRRVRGRQAHPCFQK